MNPTIDQAFAPTRALLAQLVALAPRLLGALLLFLLGLLLADLARRGTRWLVRRAGLEALAERAGAARLLYALGTKRSVAELLGSLAGFTVILVVLSAVAELLGLPGIAGGIGVLVEYLPRLLVGGAFLFGGLVVADLARRAVERAASRREDLEAPGFAGQLTYYAVLVVAVSLAAGHLGLRTGLVDALILLSAGAGLGSLGLAFALGSRPAFRSLVARHYAQRLFRPGDRLRLASGLEGRLRSYGALTAWIEDAEGGLWAVPCTELVEQAVRLGGEGGGEEEGAPGAGEGGEAAGP